MKFSSENLPSFRSEQEWTSLQSERESLSHISCSQYVTAISKNFMSIIKKKHCSALIPNFPRRNKTHTKKVAAGIKTTYTIRRTIPDNMKNLILNALVLSHIHYSATIIQSISQNLFLSLDRQLYWAVNASFFRIKIDSPRDLKLTHKALPMHYFLNIKRINYIWKIKTIQLPAFDESRGRELKTWKINKNERTCLE